jgi:hypothetical protein
VKAQPGGPAAWVLPAVGRNAQVQPVQEGALQVHADVPEGRKEQVFGPRLLPKALLQGFYPGEMLVPIELELCNHRVRSPEDLADQRVGEYAELLHRRNLLEDEQIATGDQLAALLVPHVPESTRTAVTR